MTARDAQPMNALRLAAEYLGAVIVIQSSCDRRDANGRRYLTDEPGAQLARLAVVKPNRDATTRRQQLYSGQVLCMASLEQLTVDQAANLLLDHEALAPHRNRRQAA